MVCYCTCCQDMHTFLGKENLMDAEGGLHFRMTAPGDVKFTKGVSKIKSMKLAEKTGTVRWYTDCCKSPIGCTVSELPPTMIDLSRSFIAQKADPDLLSRFLGKISMRLFADSSKKDTSALANPRPSSRSFWLFHYMYHMISNYVKWWWRGTLLPHPLYVEGNTKGKLICEPVVVKAKIA